MRKIGSFLVVIGVLAIILDFADRVPTVLFWIYNWGDGVAWVIRIVIIIAGALLYLLSAKPAKA